MVTFNAVEYFINSSVRDPQTEHDRTLAVHTRKTSCDSVCRLQAMMLSDVCLSDSDVCRVHPVGGRRVRPAGRLDGAYWLIGPGSAGLAQGCRCLCRQDKPSPIDPTSKWTLPQTRPISRIISCRRCKLASLFTYIREDTPRLLSHCKPTTTHSRVD